MKKIFFSSLLVIFVAGLAPDVFAQPADPSGFTALAPIPGLTDPSSTSVVNQGSFANFFNNLYKYLIGLAAVLAVIMITWGGLEISTKDSVSKQSDGKARIYNAIFGLVLVLSPVLVFSIINPSILNLSINLKPLDTRSVPTPQGDTQTTLPGTETFRNVGTQSSGPVLVGDKVIDKVPFPNSVPEAQRQQAIIQYQQSMAAARADCDAAGGTISLQSNLPSPSQGYPYGTVTIRCDIQTKPTPKP